MLLLSAYVLFWPSPAGSGTDLPGGDKLVHAVLFGLLAATARLCFPGRRSVLAALVGYAAVSELVQGLLLADRQGDLADLVADLVGVVAGWWLVGRADRTRRAAGRDEPRLRS